MIFFRVGQLVDIQNTHFQRNVELSPTEENDVYTYREKCSGVFQGQEFSYEEEFNIRYWSVSILDKILKENGFLDTLTPFRQFNSTGSTYKLYKKQ